MNSWLLQKPSNNPANILQENTEFQFCWKKYLTLSRHTKVKSHLQIFIPRGICQPHLTTTDFMSSIIISCKTPSMRFLLVIQPLQSSSRTFPLTQRSLMPVCNHFQFPLSATINTLLRFAFSRNFIEMKPCKR